MSLYVPVAVLILFGIHYTSDDELVHNTVAKSYCRSREQSLAPPGYSVFDQY